MARYPDRRLAPEDFAALKGEVLRAAVELSDEQLMDLTDALHGLRRLRRPGRPVSHAAGWLEEETPHFG